MPPATSPPSSSTMTTMAIGQGDGFAAEQIVLRRGGEGLPDQHVAADEDLGGVEVVGKILDLMRDRELGVLGRGRRRV